MHPFHHAANTPDKPAVITAETGEVMTYAQLDAASNRVANFFRAQGLKPGDRIAYFLENSPDYYALIWGAQRSGLLFAPISSKLTVAEVDYIIADSEAKLIVADAALTHVASALTANVARYSHGGAIPGFAPIEEMLALQPDTRIADETVGAPMLYSSGTTGRPKGIRRSPPDNRDIDAPTPLMLLASGFYGLGAHSIYLSTAAPLSCGTARLDHGVTGAGRHDCADEKI